MRRIERYISARTSNSSNNSLAQTAHYAWCNTYIYIYVVLYIYIYISFSLSLCLSLSLSLHRHLRDAIYIYAINLYMRASVHLCTNMSNYIHDCIRLGRRCSHNKTIIDTWPHLAKQKTHTHIYVYILYSWNVFKLKVMYKFEQPISKNINT